jgi:pimeloyl-ACP methyl ester carboxylesterase
VNIVTSADGTTIAYGSQGEGPAVILVDGALSIRSSGSKPELAGLLSAHFTVYGYDRRGRGDSADTLAVCGRAGDRGPRGAHRGRRLDGLPVRALLGSIPGHGSGGRDRRPSP